MYFPFSPWLILFLPILAGGCVPTLGSEFVNKAHLAEGNYIDLNTVPESAEAKKPSGLHGGNEQAARLKDQEALEKKRLDIETAGEKLRERAIANSSSFFEKKDSRNGQKSGT